MSDATEIAVAFTFFLVLLLGGMRIPYAIGVPGVLYLWLQGGIPSLNALGLVVWGSINSFTLSAIPLFIFMAEIIEQTGIGLRIYRGMSRFVYRVPGGLLQTNIVGSAMFAAVSGSSVATAATMGGVAIPELRRRGYDQRLATGSLAAGGTLGILIPPSITMIVYASFTETSVPKLFAAGVLPGLLLAALFMLYIAIRAVHNPNVGDQNFGGGGSSWIAATADIVPFLGLICLTFGSIYLGFATPTEAAALSSVLALILAYFIGDLTWPTFKACVSRTVQVSGNIMFIILAAYIYAYAVSIGQVGQGITEWLTGMDLAYNGFLIGLFVLYIILGTFLESVGLVVLTVPLLLPMLDLYGVDLLWFGVILVIYVEAGLISPPVGMNLFVIQGVSGIKLEEVIIGTLPFFGIMLIMVLILSIFPEIVLWLPNQM